MPFDHLYVLLKLFPDKPWDWNSLSRNPGFTWNSARENLDKPLDWSTFSRNENVTLDIVYENPSLPWDIEGLSGNPHLTLNDIQNLSSRGPINHRHKEWNWHMISTNSDVTWKTVQNTPSTWWNYFGWTYPKWSYRGLSTNRNITMDIVEKYSKKPWVHHDLSYNPNITIDYVKNHIDLPDSNGCFERQWINWDWLELTVSKAIKMENIEDNPRLPWRWKAVPLNPNVSWDFIRRNFNKIVTLRFVDVPWKIVKETQELPWKYDCLCRRSSIFFEDLPKIQEKSPKKIDILHEFSGNPNLTWKIVAENPSKNWEWRGFSWNGSSGISSNPFNRYNAAVRIQRWWRKKNGFSAWRKPPRDSFFASWIETHKQSLYDYILYKCSINQYIYFCKVFFKYSSV